jgi:hypothetical protein
MTEAEFVREIHECPEIFLFATLLFLNQTILESHSSLLKGKFSKEEVSGALVHIIDLQEKFGLAVSQTQRFGVQVPLIGGQPSLEYWTWFYWWNGSFHSLSITEREQFMQQQDISHWKPTVLTDK